LGCNKLARIIKESPREDIKNIERMARNRKQAAIMAAYFKMVSLNILI
jgi:hypothetical protein